MNVSVSGPGTGALSHAAGPLRPTAEKPAPFLDLLDDPARLAENMHVIASAAFDGGPDASMALDLLVNLASCEVPPEGSPMPPLAMAYARAKELLPIMYEARGAAPHVRTQVRQDLQAACHRMCELASRDKDRPVSLTVAYLAHQVQDASMRPWIQARIESSLADRGVSLSAREDVVAANRFADETELAGAARGFQSLHVMPRPLDMCSGAASRGALIEARFHAPLANLAAELASTHGPGCALARVNNGGNHWQSLLLHKDVQGEIHYHVIETHSGAQALSEADQDLASLIGRQPSFHKSNMQDFDAPNCCGPLSEHFARALEDALHQDPHCFRTADDMTAFIRQYQTNWTASDVSSEDRQAAMIATRARLLEHRRPLPAEVQLLPPAARRLVSPETFAGSSNQLKQLDDALNQLSDTLSATQKFIHATPGLAAEVAAPISACIGNGSGFPQALRTLAALDHRWDADGDRDRYLGALSSIESSLSQQRQALSAAINALAGMPTEGVDVLKMQLESLRDAIRPGSLIDQRLAALRARTDPAAAPAPESLRTLQDKVSGLHARCGLVLNAAISDSALEQHLKDTGIEDGIARIATRALAYTEMVQELARNAGPDAPVARSGLMAFAADLASLEDDLQAAVDDISSFTSEPANQGLPQFNAAVRLGLSLRDLQIFALEQRLALTEAAGRLE